MRGFHLRPDEIRHEGVVLTWGGSEGGPDFEHAELLIFAGGDDQLWPADDVAGRIPEANAAAVEAGNRILVERLSAWSR